MSKLTEARAAVEAAEQAIEAALRACIEAQDAQQRHAAALQRAEAELAELEQNVADSMKSEATAAAWRKKRAGMVAEIDGLRLQAVPLADATRKAEAHMEGLKPARDEAQRRVFAALTEDLRPEMDAAIRVLARGWCLHLRGQTRPQLVDHWGNFAEWLFDRSAGLYRFGELTENATREIDENQE